MVLGIKSEFGVEADSIPVQCTKDEVKNMATAERQRSDSIKKRKPALMRALSRAEMTAVAAAVMVMAYAHTAAA